MNHDIERLSPGDAMRLRTLRLRALRDAPDAFGSTLAETEARPPESWARQVVELPTFVAVRDGADVGMVRWAPDDERPDVRWLISMWVAPEARGAGVGGALIDALVDDLRATGAERVLLDVADFNEGAIALYARKGFEPTGESSTLPPPRAHIRELRMAFDLTPPEAVRRSP